VPRHDLDALSLVAGVAFAGLAVTALLDEGLGLPVRWGLPVLLILVGMAGLVLSVMRHRRD